ncbi:MAG: hypothetical protein ACE145_02240 [Terriglobia bacterium]
MPGQSPKHPGQAPAAVPASPALEWLWKYLRDIPHPEILDCGPVSPSSVDIYLRRGAKIHVADLITPSLNSLGNYWNRSAKVPVFETAKFLEQLPAFPAESLSTIFGWHLLDLLPREALPDLMERWLASLQPGGVLFCLLREPKLAAGAEMMWWLVNLNLLASDPEGRKPFPHPPVTNREMERLAPQCSVKTFLTRSGRREVLIVK